MLAWHERHSELFHRSNWKVGPRRGLMPLLQTYDNGSGGWGVLGCVGVGVLFCLSSAAWCSQGVSVPRVRPSRGCLAQCRVSVLASAAAPLALALNLPTTSQLAVHACTRGSQLLCASLGRPEISHAFWTFAHVPL